MQIEKSMIENKIDNFIDNVKSKFYENKKTNPLCININNKILIDISATKMNNHDFLLRVDIYARRKMPDIYHYILTSIVQTILNKYNIATAFRQEQITMKRAYKGYKHEERLILFSNKSVNNISTNLMIGNDFFRILAKD